MSRSSMALAAAAASAVVAVAVVALPAFAGESGKPARARATMAGDIGAFAACLRAHGLDAPTDLLELKPWLAGREASDPRATKAAELACSDKLPASAPKAEGPGIGEFGACLRSRGLDAPTAPEALKRWLADHEASDPALGKALAACKMQLDPGKAGAAGKPSDCGGAAPATAAKKEASGI